MRHLDSLSLIIGALLLTVSRADDDAQYVTDLPGYSLLGYCAAYALSYVVNQQTYAASCGAAEDELQTCICDDEKLRTSVTKEIFTSISTLCGGTAASADQSSVSELFAQYCDPDLTVDFSTPTGKEVSAYLTDIPEITYLAPCAYNALSYAVQRESTEGCPEAVSLFAPCVCSKSNVVERISSRIENSVRGSCSNNEDVTSAESFWDAYCGLNDGKSSFASPDGPPGDMTYYISALPEYKSLSSCAQEGVSLAILVQSDYCNTDAQALASCLCLKSGMRTKVDKTLSSYVKASCPGTATDQMPSALSAFDYYCSAAAGKVKAEVPESVTESSASGSGSSRTGSSTSSLPSETGSSGGSDSGSDSGSKDSDSSNSDGSSGGGGGTNKTAVIAASVLGAVVAIGVVAGIAFFIRRKKNKAKRGRELADSPQPHGRTELHATDAKSEISKTGSPHPGAPELGEHGLVELPHQAERSELQSHSSGDRQVPYHQTHHPHELENSPSAQLSPGWNQSPQASHATVSPVSPSQHGMGWQSGPMESYEMDSTPRRTQ